MARRSRARMGLAHLVPLLIVGGMAILASMFLWRYSETFAEHQKEVRASDIGGMVMQQKAALVVEHAYLDGNTLKVFVCNPGDIDLAVTAVWVPSSPLVFSPNAQTLRVGQGAWLDPSRYPAMQAANSSDLVEVFALPLPLYDSSDPSRNSQYQVIAYWPSTTRTWEP